jgi:DNA-binding NtrC family response regulator
MATPRKSPKAEAASALKAERPIVCIVTVDEEFVEDVSRELAPWCNVVVRDRYEDLTRWSREAGVAAVLLSIDTEGDEAFGGLPVLNELRLLNENLTLISMSRARARAVEKQSLSNGADAHFRSPVDVDELRVTLIEIMRLRAENAAREWMMQRSLEASRFQDFIGGSEPMRLVYDAIQQVADSSINVLIRGESGTGKELAARAVVALSARAKKPYIRLNCAALPETLIESELFGSEKGAFTGATESRPGQIELADGGTLFLDEIATLTPALQTKLLRVLEDHQVQRLGGAHFARSISGSFARPMSRWKRWCGTESFARISITGSTWCLFCCRLCGNARATFRCCASTFSRCIARPTDYR